MSDPVFNIRPVSPQLDPELIPLLMSIKTAIEALLGQGPAPRSALTRAMLGRDLVSLGLATQEDIEAL